LGFPGGLNILKGIPHRQIRHHGRGLAHDLENDFDGSFTEVGIDDRQRDSLPCFVDLQNDELARPTFPGDFRGLNGHLTDIFRQ
jgi:hypothetical protein